MKWYSNLFRIILKGIALVLLPVFLVVYVFYKATDLVQNWILPLESHLPAGKFMGIGWLSLLSLAIILLVCYLAGVLTENERLKPLFSFIENNLLVNIPGYTIMKSSTLEALGGEDKNRKAVVVGDEDEWKLGIEIDRQPDGQYDIFPRSAGRQIRRGHSS